MEEEDLQEMVMERDGKFEVLSAVDLQAAEEELARHDDQSRPQPTAPQARTLTAPSEELEPDLGTTDRHENTITLSGDQRESLPASKKDDTQETEEGLSSTSSLVAEPDLGSGREAGKGRDTEPLPEQENKKEQDNSSVQRAQSPDVTGSASTQTELESLSVVRAAEPTKERSLSVVRAAEPTKERSYLQPKQHIRMQSAPSASRTAKLAQQKRETEVERERKKKMSEAAFTAWVARKNEERRIIERAKSQSAKVGVSEKEKKAVCDRAYQNWVEAKKKSLRMTRPTTSVPKKDEEQCRRAFESWLESKRGLQLEESKRERIKTQEMEESATKADTSVIDRVYKE